MKKVNRILVAVDTSAMAGEALMRAISIAKEEEAQLVVMHVIESSFMEYPFGEPENENKIKQELKDWVEKFTTEEDIEYVLCIESGSAALVIAEKVKNISADLLIIGTHGKNDINSNYFGSTTLKLIQKTRIPVLIVKNEAKHIYKKMLSPTNLSNYSKESILFARALFDTAALKYLHAYVTIDAFQALTYRIDVNKQDQLKKELLTEAHIALENFVKNVAGGEKVLLGYNASINEDLLDYIAKDDADLLVLGSKGVGNLNSFLFGSTASYLVQNSPIDVLVYVPVINKEHLEKSEKKVERKEAVSHVEALESKITPVQKDLDNRKEEIMDALETLFEENLKFTNWNVPEAPDQEVAEGLMSILAEKLNEINQKIKEGKYQEKRSDIFL